MATVPTTTYIEFNYNSELLEFIIIMVSFLDQLLEEHYIFPPHEEHFLIA